ncbi:hypothetical protein Hanom_Chr00s132993g01816141 [Helianthus anomalus]
MILWLQWWCLVSTVLRHFGDFGSEGFCDCGEGVVCGGGFDGFVVVGFTAMVVKGGVSVVGRWRKTVAGGGWSEDGGGWGFDLLMLGFANVILGGAKSDSVFWGFSVDFDLCF